VTKQIGSGITCEGIETNDEKSHVGCMKTHATSGLRPPHTSIFAFDALLGFGFGVLLLLGGAAVYAASGGGLSSEALRWLGMLLLPWGYYNWRVAKAASVSRLALIVHCAVDASWILGSAWLMVRDAPLYTVWGWVLYGPQAVMVCGILVTKIARSRASFTPAADAALQSL
jgi:hypothetical protein